MGYVHGVECVPIRSFRIGRNYTWGCRTKNGVTAPFSCEKHKSQTTKSPAFAVKYIYATK